MPTVRHAIEVTGMKMLGAVAALASLMAIVSQLGLCFVWFHQPKVPDAVRMMHR